MRPLLGTYVEIFASSENQNVEIAVSKAFEAINQVHQLLSFHDSTSDLSRLNMADTGAYITLHPISIRVLRLAKAITNASGGLFNYTVGGALVKAGVLPDHTCQPYLLSGSYDDIHLNRNQAMRTRPVLVTLDGLAKGYAVDCAINALMRHGCSSGFVNAGGDLRVFGQLCLPVYQRAINNDQVSLGQLQNAAIASSSIRNEYDADFPAWIVTNQKEVVTGVYSVMSNKAWRADALTKVACVAAAENRNDILEKLGGKLALPLNT